MNRNRWIALWIMLLMLSLVACGTSQSEDGSKNNEGITLHVFAAASLTETLTTIQEQYAESEPDVTLVFNFDSSGTLKTQIEEGAECDVFLSAAEKQMDQLDSTADASVNEDGLDFVLQGTRVDLLENQVVLVVPDGNPAGIQSFEDLGTKKLSLLVLGNEDVPVGQYSTEILTNLNLMDELEKDGKITYGSNAKEVTTQVIEGSVDAGIVYATDAYSAGLEIVDVAEQEEHLCKQAIYPAAVLKESEQEDAAKTFLQYLQSEECKAVFEKAGFRTF